MTGRIVVRDRATGGGWTPEDGASPPTPGEIVYDGPFRAQALTGANLPVDAAGQQVTLRDYLLQLPAPALALEPGTRMDVLECPDDPELVGRTFTVSGSVMGSYRFTRDVFASLDLTDDQAEDDPSQPEPDPAPLPVAPGEVWA